MKQHTILNQQSKPLSSRFGMAIEWAPIGFNASTSNYDRVEGQS